MRECIVVGQPNSGKTMFVLNFANYLGSKSVDVTFRTYDELITCRHFSIEEAKRELCGVTMHKTRLMQSIILKIPLGKTSVNFKLTDTCGVTEKIHPDENIRKGMAQTLSLMRGADFIIHIIDVSCLSAGSLNSECNIDREIYHYGIARRNYLLLANKIDLLSAKQNVSRLSAYFPQGKPIPVSGLYSEGFKEVKSCVARNI